MSSFVGSMEPAADDEERPSSSSAPPPLDDRESWKQVGGAPTAPSTSTLCGNLKKRHAHEKSFAMQWSKRYFFVDDKLGNLQYSKDAKKIMSKPSMVIPLADITAVEALTGGIVGVLPNCFTVDCPPTHLVLRADDKEDQAMWMTQLRLRMDVWKRKRAAGE